VISSQTSALILSDLKVTSGISGCLPSGGNMINGQFPIISSLV
jgi:hypothetical protein